MRGAAPPQNGNRRNKSRGGGGNTTEITTEDWEAIRNFKATKIEKSEGTEKTINDIRVCLNKISAKNVDSQYTVLISLVRQIFDSHEFESEEAKRMTTLIQDICTSNKFYSEVYAGIYIRLIKEYPIFQTLLDRAFEESFLPSFEGIRYIDSNDGEKYLEFCKNNKENENRKSALLFYIQMMKHAHFDKRNLVKCAERLFGYIYKYIDEENRSYEVEEITENIYLLFTNANAELSTEQEWEDMMEKVQELAQMKHTSRPSISNRAIFKFMDLVEI